MADDRYGKLADYIRQSRQVQHVFGNAVKRSRSPRAVSVAAQIERINVKVFTERSSHPIPVAGVVETAMHQQERRLAVLAPIPELQFEAVRVEEVRGWFQAT